jgi:hypothetical protein
VRALLLVALAAGAAAAEPRRHAALADLECGDCHDPGGWRVAGGRGFDHARTGFPLTGAHALAACGDCHRRERPITRACAGCHEDPHEARLGTACDVCHGATSFRDTRARERHARTRLPLSGMHALLECAACHTRTSRAWSDVPAACVACHEAEARRPGLHPPHEGFPRACETCHRPTGWSPAVPPPSLISAALASERRRAHDRVFPISSGRHRGVACEGCHIGAPEARVTTCAGCHAATRHRATAVRPAEGACRSCHPRGTR